MSETKSCFIEYKVGHKSFVSFSSPTVVRHIFHYPFDDSLSAFLFIITCSTYFQEKTSRVTTTPESVTVDGRDGLTTRPCLIARSSWNRRLVLDGVTLTSQINMQEHIPDQTGYKQIYTENLSKDESIESLCWKMNDVQPTSPMFVSGSIKSATPITTPTVTLKNKWGDRKHRFVKEIIMIK